MSELLENLDCTAEDQDKAPGTPPEPYIPEGFEFRFYGKQFLIFSKKNPDKTSVDTYIAIDKITTMSVYAVGEKYRLDVMIGTWTFSVSYEKKDSAMFFVKKISRILDEKHR